MTQNERHTGSKRRKNAKASPEEATDAESLAERVCRYLTSHDARVRAQILSRLCEQPTDALAAVFAAREEGHGTHDEARTLAFHLAKRDRTAAVARASSWLRDDHQREPVRLLALEVLGHLGATPAWKELREIALGLSMKAAPRLVAACLENCTSQKLPIEDCVGFLTHAEARPHRKEDAPAVIASVSLIEDLLAEHVPRQTRERAFEACFNLMHHPAPAVRVRALEAICLHCPLHWIERLRLVPWDMANPVYMERLNGLMNRLWTQPLDLLTLSPTGFEHLAREWLRGAQYTSVSRRGVVHDEGVDLYAIDPDGAHCIVQCKRWSPQHEIDRALLMELREAVINRHAQRGIFVTTSTFKKSAVTYCAQSFAHDQRVRLELVDGHRLVRDLEGVWGPGMVRIGADAARLPAQLELGAPPRPPRAG